VKRLARYVLRRRKPPAEPPFHLVHVTADHAMPHAIKPSPHGVTFSFGGSLLKPKLARTISLKALAEEPKWSRFRAAEIRGTVYGADHL
jgi:hypothetical protein